MAIKYSTPLRYPGGKSKLANFIRLVFTDNNLIGSEYVEPYAGGAGVALHLLFSGYTNSIHINDLNKSIYAFWISVLENADELCRMIYDTPVTIETWKQQKIVQGHSDDCSLLDLGFSTFFLNRTNRSGIISGGVIGGKNQDGVWKIDARYNKRELISRIERISRVSDNIHVYNLDAYNFISKQLPELSPRAFIYLDPPYFNKGGDLYENHYEYDDHIAISRLLNEIQQKWIVSYDCTPEIQVLYAQYRSFPYNLSYSAANRYKGSEEMYFCNDLVIPDVEDPVRIRAIVS